MKPNDILSALQNLDPTNDDHWTGDGQPRLGAIGSNVTRSEVQAIAPTFNRETAEIPEPAPVLTDEEVVLTLEEQLMEIELAREEAATALKAACKDKLDAENAIRDAQQKLEQIRDDEKLRDPRTPGEINRDYLKSEFNQRLARAGAQAQARQLLEQAGLGSQVKSLTASPIDRAIAERVMAERRKKPFGVK